MKRWLPAIPVFLLISTLLGCTLRGTTSPPKDTLSTPTATRTTIPTALAGEPSHTPPATVTPLPSVTGQGPEATITLSPTPAPTTVPTTAPTATVAQAVLTPTSPPTKQGPTTAAPTGEGFTQVLIYLIAVGDNGASGPKIGCDDSVIAVRRNIAPTRGVLRAALTELLSLKDQYFGESGLYNALYQSNLSVSDLTIDAQGTAIIQLTGQMALGGTCDAPRVKAQLEYTAFQFSTVKAVNITINGTPLDQALSQR